jgi:malonyl-CoA O-methyltransferase
VNSMPVDDAAYRVDKRQAKLAFERAAATYDAAAVLQKEVGRRMTERLDLIRLQPARILDLGAGTGEFSRALMRRYRKSEVVALDLALNMLRHTRRRGGWFRRPRCICGDAERLPFAEGSFQFIFSNLVLQWFQDLEPVFTEVRRVLAPGGLLMFSTFGPDTLMELRASWEVVDGNTHVNRFIDLHDVGDALVRTRWAEPVMDAERITVTYREARTLMQDLKQLGAHNITAGRPRGLTGKHRLQRVVQTYENYRRDGVLPASYEVIYGHAWAPPEKPAAGGVEVRLTVPHDRGRPGRDD